MAINIKKIPANSHAHGGSRALSSVKYIVIHYTGGVSDTAENEGNYFKNSNTRSAGAHYFIDLNGNIVESVDMSLIAWSVGGAKYSDCASTGGGKYYGICTNANSVSIELCAIADKSPSDAMIKSTKSLIDYIQKSCPNARTLVRHFDVNGKRCPATMIDANVWNTFLKKINNTSSSTVSTTTSTTTKTTTTTTSTVSTTTVKKTSSTASLPTYTVGKIYKTQVDNLNIRVAPSTSASKKTYAQLSANAKQNANSKGQLKKNTSVTCKAVKQADGYLWIQIPSGWIAAYVISDKKYYVK